MHVLSCEVWLIFDALFHLLTVSKGRQLRILSLFIHAHSIISKEDILNNVLMFFVTQCHYALYIIDIDMLY